MNPRQRFTFDLPIGLKPVGLRPLKHRGVYLTFDFGCFAIFTTKQRISFSVPLADGVILWQSYLDT